MSGYVLAHGPSVFADSINSTDFVTTWDTSGGQCDTCITIPAGSSGTGYDYDIDWNNDGTFDQFNVDSFITHDFGVEGEYTIRIRGDFPKVNMAAVSYPSQKRKLMSVDQWGDIEWHSMELAFWDANNVHINASDTPDLSRVTNMDNMFLDAAYATGDMSD